MLATLKQVLTKAQKGKYAVGAFNINNLEIMQAITNAASKLKSPVILQTSEGAIDYAGINYLKCLVSQAAQDHKIPIVLHLDHGRNMEIIKKAIKTGYTSIMYDGSHLPFEKNISNTKKVVSMAHARGISVEGELGTIGGAEEKIVARKIIYTDPNAAKEFVEKTGIDALAVAIGTSHGAYKFAGAAKLDINRLMQIRQIVRVPLVLHGASGVPEWLVRTAEHYGAKLGKPEGVPDEQIKEAIKNGICKINTDTDLRLAFDAGVREFLASKPEDFDPRHILGRARELMQEVVEHRIKLFGSAGKAQ
ncbi:MAG: class II fructose-1,6-bisphosphate aldolase [Candidatus Woesearchaeota archaeon]